MTPKVRRAVLQCARELDALGADWAVGGAVAMGVHGYERATADVDVFIADDVREELLERLTRRGMVPLAAMEPFHYTVVPDVKNPEARVDLLFPALGVESLALMAATRKELFGKLLPVWPLAHLVAHKLVTDPAVDPDRAAKDAGDLSELRARGLIDAEKVGELLDDVRDRGARARLAQLVRGSPAPARRRP